MKVILIISIMLISLVQLKAQTKTPAKKTSTSAGTKTAATKYKIGSKIDAKYKEKWYIATVVKMEGDTFFVHYDDYTNDYDEWVTKDRMRNRQLTSVATDTGSNNGSTASSNSIVISNPCDYDQELYFNYNGNSETVIVKKKSTQNKTVYNGTVVTQKSRSFGTRDVTTVQSYMSTVNALCE